MNFMKWILVIVGFLLIWKFLLPLVGLSSSASFWISAVFTLATVLLIGKFWPVMRIPIPFLSGLGVLPLLAIIGITLFMGGALSTWFPSGTVVPSGTTPSGAAASTDACQASVSNKDLVGKAATLYLNGYDKESSTPSTVWDLGSNAWVYRNVQTLAGYKGTTVSTAGTALAGFAVGDTVYVYGGNATVYVAPYSACVNSETPQVNLNSYKLATTGNLQVICYDSTGSATMTAGTSGKADYNLTLGSNDAKFIYCELTVNAANVAFIYDGVAIAKFFNISNVVPVSDDMGNTYTAVAPLLAFQAVNVGTPSTAINKDYIVYQIQSPKIMSQWDTVKVKFKVETTTNNPRTDTDDSATFNGFAVLFIDASNAKANDGSTFLDFYAHTTAQDNAGLAETLTSPAGKDNGALISAQ